MIKKVLNLFLDCMVMLSLTACSLGYQEPVHVYFEDINGNFVCDEHLDIGTGIWIINGEVDIMDDFYDYEPYVRVYIEDNGECLADENIKSGGWVYIEDGYIDIEYGK